MKVFKTEKIVLFKAKNNRKTKENHKILIEPKKQIVYHSEQPKQKPNKKKFIGKKTYYFFVEKIDDTCKKEGRWDYEEHIKFLEAVDKFGFNWHKIKALIPTRTIVQIKTHACKFLNKLKAFKGKELGIDLTLNSIQTFNDVINHIKSVNKEYSIFNIFKLITDKSNNTHKSKEVIEHKKNENNNIFIHNKTINNTFYNIYNPFSKNIIEDILHKDVTNTNFINNTINNIPINLNLMSDINLVNYLDLLTNYCLNNIISCNIMNNINNYILINNLQNLNNYYLNVVQNNIIRNSC